MTTPEETKLKQKINALIDKISKMEEVMNHRDAEMEQLRQDIKILEQRKNFSGANDVELTDNNRSKIYDFMYEFCEIVGLIMANEDYVPYSYKTKYSENFYKVEKNIFEDYICKYSKGDLKTFLNFCIDLNLIKSEANRKCCYNSAEIMVYYISRVFMDMAAQRMG